MDGMAFRAPHRGKLFYAYLLSYAAILLIPIGMSFLVFQRANSIVLSETTRANNLLLQQMTSQLDRIMIDVFQLRSLLSNNDGLESLLYGSGPTAGNDYYYAYVLSREFNNFHIANGGAIDFYVYLPSVDLVISPHGYFTARSYHITRRQGLDVDYDEWVSSFAAWSRAGYRADQTQTETAGVIPTLALVTPLPVGPASAAPRGWGVIHVDRQLIDGVFADSSWSDESLLFIGDRRFGVLAHSSSVEAHDLEAYEQSVVDGLESGRVVLGDRAYRVSAKPSQVADWHYFSLVPENIYSERFGALTRFTIAAFIVCIGIGVIVIFWFASARYRPVHALLEILEPDTDGSVSLRSDEFATIINSIEHRLAEDRRLQDEVSRTRPLLTQRYLQQLMRGVSIHDDDAATRLKTLGVAFDAYTQLVLIEVDEVPDAREESVDAVAVIEREIDSLPAMRSWMVYDIEGTMAVLTSREHAPDDELFEWASLVRGRLESVTGRPCAVGMSSVHPGRDGLVVAYREARSALRYRLVLGRMQPIRFSDVQTTGRTYYYPLEIEGRLINSIRAGDYEAAAGIVSDVYAHNFQDNSLTIDMARCLMFDLTSTMIKTLNSIESIIDDATFWARVRPITNLTECRSLEQLTHAMDRILVQTCRHVLQNRSSHSQRLRDEIVAFIHDRLTDRSLGPELVAEHFGRNAAYLSRFFRDELSIGMSGYIKQERVARAKRMLVETTLTVREIADQIGFMDSNALIRAFKEDQGLTPGEFRLSVAGSSAPN